MYVLFGDLWTAFPQFYLPFPFHNIVIYQLCGLPGATPYGFHALKELGIKGVIYLLTKASHYDNFSY